MPGKAAPPAVSESEVKTATIHGRTVGYTESGSGPVLLLVHGMAGNSGNCWRSTTTPPCPRS